MIERRFNLAALLLLVLVVVTLGCASESKPLWADPGGRIRLEVTHEREEPGTGPLVLQSAEFRAVRTIHDVLTIRGRGITPRRGSQRGDLRVGVHVVTPTRLDHKERALIEEFAKRTKAPGPRLAEFHKGLFAKLRDRFRNG